MSGFATEMWAGCIVRDLVRQFREIPVTWERPGLGSRRGGFHGWNTPFRLGWTTFFAESGGFCEPARSLVRESVGLGHGSDSYLVVDEIVTSLQRFPVDFK